MFVEQPLALPGSANNNFRKRINVVVVGDVLVWRSFFPTFLAKFVISVDPI